MSTSACGAAYGNSAFRLMLSSTVSGLRSALSASHFCVAGESGYSNESRFSSPDSSDPEEEEEEDEDDDEDEDEPWVDPPVLPPALPQLLLPEPDLLLLPPLELFCERRLYV